MTLRPLLSLLPPAVLLCACATAPEPRQKGDPNDPLLQEQIADKKLTIANEKAWRDYMRVLMRLEDALETYVGLIGNGGVTDGPKKLGQVERLIHDLVNGHDVNPADAVGPTRGNYSHLLATAADGSVVANQGTALAALGFSGNKEVLSVLVNGAMSTDPFLVDRAVLGLAVLRDPQTPIGVLAKIMDDPAHAEESRAQAAWAIFRVQETVLDKEPVLTVWRRLVAAEPGTVLAPVLMTAIRGLGVTRDPGFADVVARHARHPMPKVREAVAIALGRMNAQMQVETLLGMLGTDETSPNVRLWASKALTQLAGGVDRGYDVKAWRQVFDRQPAPVQLLPAADAPATTGTAVPKDK
ncbi:MAG: HEAT repeat domain-containing protein [Planctomycetes bacterium]|nr:HEAT repeat domain-containing protein [Planctomycetota bacterium]